VVSSLPEKLYSMGEAKLLLGVSTRTIQRWDKAGKLRIVRTIGGRRRIPESEVLRIQGDDVLRDVVGYARVSSAGQKDDLERQVSYIQSKGISKIYKDIGSGMNEKRKGFRKVIERVLHNEISKVVVVYEDRLTRFGFDTIKEVFQSHGTQIETLNQIELRSPQQEMAEDLITIISHFSGKLYGLRSHKYEQVVKNAKDSFVVA